MSLTARLPTVLCQAATGRGRRRLPASGTESVSSVISSPDGSCRSTGSAATVPARTTTFTVTMRLPPFHEHRRTASDISEEMRVDQRFPEPIAGSPTLAPDGGEDVRRRPWHRRRGHVHGRAAHRDIRVSHPRPGAGAGGDGPDDVR